MIATVRAGCVGLVGLIHWSLWAEGVHARRTDYREGLLVWHILCFNNENEIDAKDWLDT